MKACKVIDSSAILHGDLDYSKGAYLLPCSVLGEILDENARTVADQAVARGTFVLREPSGESLKKASLAASETGDLPKLSATDLDVLALALETGAEIISDDYAIQNVAARLGIAIERTAQKGITRQIMWSMRCPGCAREYGAEKAVCDVCGSQLRRKGKKDGSITRRRPPCP